MKYTKYIIVPALAILASCGGTQNGGGISNAELDAKVDAKVKAAMEQTKTDCDARVALSAQMKADSIIAVAAGKKPAAPVVAKKVVVAPVHHDKVKSDVKTTKTVTHTKDDRFNNGGKDKVNANDTKAKDDRFKNGGKQTVTPEDTKRKDERFK